MVPSCQAQHDQQGMEPIAPWVEHWVSSQMPLFLRSLMFTGFAVQPFSIHRSLQVHKTRMPGLDHPSRSSIAMFTVFLSPEEEICCRHHFSTVALKVWQNFHTEVRSLPLNAHLHHQVSPKLHLRQSSSSSLSLSFSETFNPLFSAALFQIDQISRAGRHKSIGNEGGLEGSKTTEPSVSSF